MNGWFPKINKGGDIISGDSGIWVTINPNKYIQIDTTGTRPIWVSSLFVYNRNNGQTQFGPNILNVAYNDYIGSDDTRWAGFTAGLGSVDIYDGRIIVRTIPKACIPRFATNSFGYLIPYQPKPDNIRQLMVNDSTFTSGIITNWDFLSPEIVVVQEATGTYTRVFRASVAVVNVTTDENLIKLFHYKNEVWIVSNTSFPDGMTFVRPLDSYYGYFIKGILMNPDARVIDNSLRLVASDNLGMPKFDNWINFSQPRFDLRLVS